MSRILLFGDVHYSKDSSFEECRWYPHVVALLRLFSRRSVERFLAFWDFRTRLNFTAFLASAAANYDAAICLGDMTPGVREAGLVSTKSIREAREAKRLLDTTLGIPCHFVLGNHDVGYRGTFPRREGGISKSSLRTASEVYGVPPFYSFTVGEEKFVALASCLFGNNRDLEEMRHKQLRFLRTQLDGGKSIFLLLHDPFPLFRPELRNVLTANEHRIAAIFCGGTHVRVFGTMVAKFLPFSRKVIPIPAIMGVGGVFGAGYAELLIEASGWRCIPRRLDWKRGDSNTLPDELQNK